MNTTFSYRITLTDNNEFFKSVDIQENFPKANGMIIDSADFDDFNTCLENMLSLLGVLASEMSMVSKTNYTVVTVENPFFYSENESDLETAMEADQWDKSTIVRSYISDIESTKQMQIIYKAIGEITISGDLEDFDPNLLDIW